MLGATFSVEQENFQPFSLSLQPPSSACEKLRYFSDSPNLLFPYHPPFPGAWVEISSNPFQCHPSPIDVWDLLTDDWDGHLWEWKPMPVAADHIDIPPTNDQSSSPILAARANQDQSSENSDLPRRMVWDWLFLTRYAAKSQFDQLRRIPITGKANFPSIACLALEGNDFHGSQGRTWTTNIGNLHLSTLITPQSVPQKKLMGSEWIIAASVAIHAGLTKTCKNQIKFEIKWMNDVLSQGRKIAGALTATEWTGDCLNRLVWGIGLNVHYAPSADPNSAGFSPICLSDLLNPNQTNQPDGSLFWECLINLLESLSQSYDSVRQVGLKDIYSYYISHAAFLGQEIQIFDPDSANVQSGILEEIRTDLSLKIRSTQTGRVETCRRGRMFKAVKANPANPSR